MNIEQELVRELEDIKEIIIIFLNGGCANIEELMLAHLKAIDKVLKKVKVANET